MEKNRANVKKLRSNRAKYSIAISISKGENVYDLIHGSCIRIVQGDKELLNCGLATLLEKATITQAASEAKGSGFLVIPLPIPVINERRIEIYRAQNGRAVGVAFAIK